MGARISSSSGSDSTPDNSEVTQDVADASTQETQVSTTNGTSATSETSGTIARDNNIELKNQQINYDPKGAIKTHFNLLFLNKIL